MKLGIPWATGLEKTNVQQSVFHRQGRPSAARQGQVNRNPTRAAFGRPPFILITEWASKQSILYEASMQKGKEIEKCNIFTNHHVVLLHFTCIHRCIDIKFANETKLLFESNKCPESTQNKKLFGLPKGHSKNDLGNKSALKCLGLVPFGKLGARG